MSTPLRYLTQALSNMLGVQGRTEFYELRDSLKDDHVRGVAVLAHLAVYPFPGVTPTVEDRQPRPDYPDWRAARAALPEWEPMRDELLRIVGPVPTVGKVNNRPSDPHERAARKVCSMHLTGLADVPAILAHLKTVPPVGAS